MRTAKELEAAYSREAVQLIAKGNSGGGVLSLAGGDTSVTLNTEHAIDDESLDTGWFDATLQTNGGEKVLLHNALTSQSTYPRGSREGYESKIFPNMIIFNAEGLLPHGKVREIRFTASGLEDIFHYEIAEWQSLYKAAPEVLRQVEELRKLERDYPRKYEYFLPSSVYIVHELPRVLRERVSDKTFEIFLGRRESNGRKLLTIESLAIATIRFSKPTSIDDALDDAWAWRRFFQQIALKPLPFTSLSCRGRTKRGDRYSDIYLSNADPVEEGGKSEGSGFGPRHVPYGQWRHRKKLAVTMRQWLERDGERHLFRARLDRVIEEKRKQVSTKLIADLCSAVESLEEIQKASDLTEDDFASIVDAAALAGARATPTIQKDRLTGILSLLRHQSLPQRLKTVAREVEGELPKDVAKIVIKVARDIRTFEAHGGRWDEMTVPLVFPALDILTSMCVLWDLTTCGMPTAFDDRRLYASQQMSLGVNELHMRRSLRAQSAQTIRRAV